MFSKYLFGLFTFALGLVLGMFLNNTIRSLFPEDMDGALIGVILVVVLIVLYVVWRIAERISGNKKRKREAEGEA